MSNLIFVLEARIEISSTIVNKRQYYRKQAAVLSQTGGSTIVNRRQYYRKQAAVLS